MSVDSGQIKVWAESYVSATPQSILELAVQNFSNLALSFSGAEDVVLVDMLSKITLKFSVFCLDTGRLAPQTYSFLERVREHYHLEIEILFPDSQAVEKLVKTKGLYSFYPDGHQECCAIRKVAPLRRKLQQLDAWITGQRQDQSANTRAALPLVQEDALFSTATQRLVKFNPLSHWTSTQVWQYIRDNDVPYNELHEQGFISIGCEPCTRPVLPNQPEREGRWWWEDPAHKECGLHVSHHGIKPR